MANKMLSNIQSLTQAVETLTRKVNDLYSSIDKVSKISGEAVSGAQDILSSGGQIGLGQGSGMGLGVANARFAPTAAPGMPGQATTQMMPGSMGRFTFSYQFATPDPEVAMIQNAMIGGGGGGGGGGIPLLNRFTGPAATGAFGAAKVGLGLAAFGYAAAPDLSMTMQRNIGFYQAALRMPGTNRAGLERQTLGALGGGLSSVGSDAIVAALLSSRGFGPGNASYNQIVGEVGGAFRYLGIENAAAANAITSMQTGSMSSTLYGLGVSVYDARTNRARSTGDIARQLMNVMAPGGVSGPQAVQESLAYGGALAANLDALNLDPAMRVMIEQGMIDIASGRNPDLRTATPTGENPNTVLTTAGRMSQSQTRLMMTATDSMIQGFENAADTVEAFNRALENVVGPIAQLKGFVGGVGGTNVGEGIAAAVPLIISGLKDIIRALTGGGGGGTSGYGASFGAARLGGRGGGSSSLFAGSAGFISAMFGDKDSSGLWSSTNGTHTGTDFAVPVGTPVKSALEGVVSSISPGADYGTAVVIDHPNGYQTLYGHLSSREVNVGDTVRKGQRIGRSGDTGNTTGPHLHYEVRMGKNNPVDPSNLNAGNPVGNSSVEYAPVLGTGKEKDWATQLLGRLNAPATESNIAALNTWMRFEGGHWKNSAHYNPLNTTLDMGGNKSMNSVGVKRYQSWEQGLEATVSTLLGKSSAERGYAAIVQALQSDAGVSTILNAVNNSAWRSGKINDPGYKFSGGASSGFGASMPDQAVQPSGTQNVYITVKFEQPDDQTALRFAKQVQSYLDRQNNNSLIGGN